MSKINKVISGLIGTALLISAAPMQAAEVGTATSSGKVNSNISDISTASFSDIFESQSSLREKITPYVGGSGAADADVTRFKSYAQLRVDYGTTSFGFCGATILSDTLIMSAAHCFYTKTSDAVYEYDDELGYDVISVAAVYEIKDQSRFGVVVKNPTSRDIAMSEIKKIKSFYVNPLFKFKDQAVGETRTQVEFDIAIIELETPIHLSDNVESVTLPENRDYDINPTNPDYGDKTELVGLGSPGQDPAPDFLKHTESLIKLDNNEYIKVGETPEDDIYYNCLKYYDGKFDDSVICTDYISESGDSGGPLFHTDKNGTLVQIGIVNSGDYGNSYFTEVFNYVDWINDTVNTQGFNIGSPLYFDSSKSDLNGVHSYGDAGYVVDENTDPDFVPPIDGLPDNESSGGSAGIFSILGLAFVAYRRKKNS